MINNIQENLCTSQLLNYFINLPNFYKEIVPQDFYITQIADNSFLNFWITLFITSVLFLAMLIVFSKNVIYCLLCLILLYLITTVLFLSYNVSFVGFALVLVSVGAVCILFLYVIFMSDMKAPRQNESWVSKFNIGCFLLAPTLFAGSMYAKRHDLFLLKTDLSSGNNLSFSSTNVLNEYFENNILELYGFIIYNQKIVLFILIGVVLLSALIGSILLTRSMVPFLNETEDIQEDFSIEENSKVAKKLLRFSGILEK
jgi:NADH-quinone oxidoreductase subunit J